MFLPFLNTILVLKYSICALFLNYIGLLIAIYNFLYKDTCFVKVQQCISLQKLSWNVLTMNKFMLHVLEKYLYSKYQFKHGPQGLNLKIIRLWSISFISCYNVSYFQNIIFTKNLFEFNQKVVLSFFKCIKLLALKWFKYYNLLEFKEYFKV